MKKKTLWLIPLICLIALLLFSLLSKREHAEEEFPLENSGLSYSTVWGEAWALEMADGK